MDPTPEPHHTTSPQRKQHMLHYFIIDYSETLGASPIQL
jgi:hypothetical protein